MASSGLTKRAPECEQRVRQVEVRRCAALLKLDFAQLDALFAPDLVHIHSNGMVHDKAALLRHIERRGIPVTVERGPLDVRVMGHVAVMHGNITNRTPQADGGTLALDGIATQVLRCDEGVWRFVSFQFTAMMGKGA